MLYAKNGLKIFIPRIKRIERISHILIKPQAADFTDSYAAENRGFNRYNPKESAKESGKIRSIRSIRGSFLLAKVG